MHNIPIPCMKEKTMKAIVPIRVYIDLLVVGSNPAHQSMPQFPFEELPQCLGDSRGGRTRIRVVDHNFRAPLESGAEL
jgi:hypothetical protein